MTDITAEIDAMIARARKAQQAFESTGNQERFDNAAKAAAWALMEPSRNSELAAFAVAETGLGNVDDKITKNHLCLSKQVMIFIFRKFFFLANYEFKLRK